MPDSSFKFKGYFELSRPAIRDACIPDEGFHCNRHFLFAVRGAGNCHSSVCCGELTLHIWVKNNRFVVRHYWNRKGYVSGAFLHLIKNEDRALSRQMILDKIRSILIPRDSKDYRHPVELREITFDEVNGKLRHLEYLLNKMSFGSYSRFVTASETPVENIGYADINTLDSKVVSYPIFRWGARDKNSFQIGISIPRNVSLEKLQRVNGVDKAVTSFLATASMGH